MIKNLAEDLAVLLAANGIIKLEDCDAYRYGLELFISKAIMYIIVFIIALLTKTLLFSILFIGMYSAIRQYSGGFHCKSAEMCLVVSILIYLVALFIYIINFENVKIPLMIITLVTPLIVMFFSPVETPNNPLTNEEKKKYHLNTMITSIILLIISCISLITNITSIFYASAGSLTADAVLIILSLRRSKNEENGYESGSDNG